MYIRRSVMKGIIILAGVCALIALAAVFCFTETQIPPTIFCGAWIVCLLFISHMAGKNSRR